MTVVDLIRSQGQHRWTWRDRITAQVRRFGAWLDVHLWAVVLFWGTVVAGFGFVAGFVWGQAMS